MENNINWEKINDQLSIAHFISAQDKQRIYLKKWHAKVASESEKVIFLFHDICQYHGRFESMVKWCQEKNPNISFIAMDFVGHGLSSGTRGHFDEFDFLVQDIFRLLDKEQKLSHSKWFILAHGLGGLGILDLLNRYPSRFAKKIDGLILSNFIFELEQQPLIKWINNSFSSIGSRVRYQKVFHGSEITSDHEEALLFEKDSLIVHRPTRGALQAIKSKIETVYRDAYFLDLPILLLLSGDDKYLRTKGIEYFVMGVKKNLLSEKNYSNFKHDLYNEKEKKIVYNDILEWIYTNEKNN